MRFGNLFLQSSQFFEDTMNRLLVSRSLRQCRPGISFMSSCPVGNEQIKSFEEIPGPRILPVIGTMFDAYFQFHRKGVSKAILQLPQERVQQFGNIYYEQLAGNVKSVHINDLSDVESVFRNEQSLPRRTPGPLMKYFWEKFNRKPGVFFASGPDWYKYRSGLGKTMLLPRAMAQHTPEMNVIASEVITRIKTLRNSADSATTNEVKNIDFELLKWAFESVSYVVLETRFHSISDSPDPLVKEFIDAVAMFFNAASRAILVPPQTFAYYETKAQKAFNTGLGTMYILAEYFITQRVKHLKDSGKLSLSTVSKAEEHKLSLFEYLLVQRNFSEKELLLCIIDLLIAGIDTVSNTMQWIMYELAKNPDKQATLYNEIISHTPSPDQCVVINDQLQHMPYLKAVVKETLRLHPILPVLRRILQKDLVLSGYKVPTGTPVAILSYATSHDPNIFHDPERFLPERWLGLNKEEKPNHFGSLPFGHGRRMCIGRRLAELEMHVLLYHIICNFHLQYPENEILETTVRGTLSPEKPVQVKFFDRF